MNQLAANLVDSVIPSVPTRHWVLSFPINVRFLLAWRPTLQMTSAGSVDRVAVEHVNTGVVDLQNVGGDREFLDALGDGLKPTGPNRHPAVQGSEGYLKPHALVGASNAIHRLVIRVLARQKVPQQARRHDSAQFAVYCNHELTAYDFTPSKHGEHFTNFLRVEEDNAYTGFLVADAASNMNTIFENGKIVECGCWYHLRDKFAEAKVGASLKAEEALAWIGTIFDVEQTSKEQDETAEERLTRRRRETKPLLDSFERWMEETKQQFLPDEELYKAIQYFTNHRDALLRFMTDGQITLTNNLAERELGVIGRGRKNYLFAGSAEGGRRLGILYTVVRSCQRLGIDPWEYMADVLPRLSDLPVNRGRGHLKTLTPWAWTATTRK